MIVAIRFVDASDNVDDEGSWVHEMYVLAKVSELVPNAVQLREETVRIIPMAHPEIVKLLVQFHVMLSSAFLVLFFQCVPYP